MHLNEVNRRYISYIKTIENILLVLHINSTIMAKVLVVTDYSGALHITPTGNKNYYLKQNRLIKNKQFGLQEMDEDAAYKFVEDNKGRDPKYVKPSDTQRILGQKDKQIEDLRAQIEALQKGGANGTDGPLKATEVIDKIKAATTAEEVQALAKDDTRATVIAAAASKLEDLKKQ